MQKCYLKLTLGSLEKLVTKQNTRQFIDLTDDTAKKATNNGIDNTICFLIKSTSSDKFPRQEHHAVLNDCNK